jgi:outer membrane lipopolysaccharide assembly protein LptE/RlpB
MKRLLQVCFLFTAVSFLSLGCGYTSRSMISDKFRTINIAPFTNKIVITQDSDAANRYKINKPMLETDITKAVIDKYLFDGNLRPAEKADADLYLKGELIEFRRDPVRYTDSDEVEEYRLNLVVNLSLWDNAENKLVWAENGFTGDTTYFTMGQLAKSEDAAIRDAVTDLARRIVERTVEQW